MAPGGGAGGGRRRGGGAAGAAGPWLGRLLARALRGLLLLAAAWVAGARRARRAAAGAWAAGAAGAAGGSRGGGGGRLGRGRAGAPAGGGGAGGRVPEGLRTAAVVLVPPAGAAARSPEGCAALAGAAAFCARAGARGVWLYEPGGALKEGSFPEQFAAAVRLWRGGEAASVQLLWHGRARTADGAAASGRARPPLQGRPVVYLASAEDGTEPVEEAAAVLAGAAQDGNGEALVAGEGGAGRGGGPAALERRVAAAMGGACGTHACEEVDLVLVAGEVLTLAGFPPWLTRSSEIYHFAGGLQDLSERNLERTLAKYYCTAQRLGA